VPKKLQLSAGVSYLGQYLQAEKMALNQQWKAGIAVLLAILYTAENKLQLNQKIT
jgi:hypothetical protein